MNKSLQPVAAYELVQKHKVTPVYWGDLITYMKSFGLEKLTYWSPEKCGSNLIV